MLSIFNGERRGIDDNGKSAYMQLEFQFRDWMHEFKGAKLAVFLCIALHSDPDGESFPSYELIERETGYGTDTIGRALEDLCKQTINGHRILHRRRIRGDGGHYVGSNRYIVFPKGKELEELEGVSDENENSSTSGKSRSGGTRSGKSRSNKNQQNKEEPLNTRVRKNRSENRSGTVSVVVPIAEEQNVTEQPSVSPPAAEPQVAVVPDAEIVAEVQRQESLFSIDTTPDPLDAPDPVIQNPAPVLPTPVSDTAERFKARTLAAMAKSKPYMDASGLNVLDLDKYPEDTREMVALFCQLWHMQPPVKKSTVAFWIEGSRELIDSCGEIGLDVIREVRKDFENRMAKNNGLPPYDVSSPRSLVNVARGMAGRMREKGLIKVRAQEQTGGYFDVAGEWHDNGPDADGKINGYYYA